LQKTCRVCKGRGTIRTALPMQMDAVCARCRGRGKVQVRLEQEPLLHGVLGIWKRLRAWFARKKGRKGERG